MTEERGSLYRQTCDMESLFLLDIDRMEGLSLLSIYGEHIGTLSVQFLYYLHREGNRL